MANTYAMTTERFIIIIKQQCSKWGALEGPRTALCLLQMLVSSGYLITFHTCLTCGDTLQAQSQLKQLIIGIGIFSTTVSSKNILLLSLFVVSKMITPKILWVGTRNSERLMWKNNSLRNNACKITVYYL
jgi:hypothetical protein